MKIIFVNVMQKDFYCFNYEVNNSSLDIKLSFTLIINPK
jgi:hypothetical protein